MNPEVSHKPSQPHSNDAKLTVPESWVTEISANRSFVRGDEAPKHSCWGLTLKATHPATDEPAKQCED